MENEWIDTDVQELCIQGLLGESGLWFNTETLINRVVEMVFLEWHPHRAAPTDRQMTHALKVLHKEGRIERREVVGKKGRPAYEWMVQK